MARAGTKKRPVYHIVVADSRYPRDGRFIERLGYFNPLLPKDNADRLKFDIEKAKGWLDKGATPTDRILRFLDAAGVRKRAPRNNPERALPRKERKARAEEPPRLPLPPRPLPRRRRRSRRDVENRPSMVERICVARIGAPHGTGGEVKLWPFTASRSGDALRRSGNRRPHATCSKSCRCGRARIASSPASKDVAGPQCRRVFT